MCFCSQGVLFAVYLHPARALTELKSLAATPIDLGLTEKLRTTVLH